MDQSLPGRHALEIKLHSMNDNFADKLMFFVKFNLWSPKGKLNPERTQVHTQPKVCCKKLLKLLKLLRWPHLPIDENCLNHSAGTLLIFFTLWADRICQIKVRGPLCLYVAGVAIVINSPTNNIAQHLARGAARCQGWQQSTFGDYDTGEEACVADCETTM